MKPRTTVLSRNLRYLRERENFSQSMIAAALDCSPSRLSRYENGNREPDMTTLQQLAKLYRVTVDLLLTFPFDEEESS